MSVNPSNRIAEMQNPGKTPFPNLAREKGDRDSYAEVDQAMLAELKAAGIPTEGPCESLRNGQEVPWAYVGNLHGWGFRRAWYYWVATGPGIPCDVAMELWDRHKDVRVDGHCGSSSPLEWFKGFSVGHYHVDTLEGLIALADTIRSVYRGEK